MEEVPLQPPTAAEIDHYQRWWFRLSSPWKKAFNEAYYRRSNEEMLPDEVLHNIWNAPALRFAGPTALHPNMTFELEDLSGIAELTKVTILVVAHNAITTLDPIAHWLHLESLFVFNNRLTDINAVSRLTNLKEIYLQNNDVESLKPLEHITGLHTIYCNYTKISSLEGIGEQHADNLRRFICLPNDNLRDREIMRFEREVGIRCSKA